MESADFQSDTIFQARNSSLQRHHHWHCWQQNPLKGMGIIQKLHYLLPSIQVSNIELCQIFQFNLYIWICMKTLHNIIAYLHVCIRRPTFSFAIEERRQCTLLNWVDIRPWKPIWNQFQRQTTSWKTLFIFEDFGEIQRDTWVASICIMAFRSFATEALCSQLKFESNCN